MEITGLLENILGHNGLSGNVSQVTLVKKMS